MRLGLRLGWGQPVHGVSWPREAVLCYKPATAPPRPIHLITWCLCPQALVPVPGSFRGTTSYFKD